MSTVLDLLSGDAQTFTEKVWASRPHLHRADPAALVGLLSLNDVDHLLTETAIRTPAVRVAQDGSVLAEARFTRSGATVAGKPLSGLVDARKVLDLYAGGATVVLQGLHRYWPPLTRLIAGLEQELGHPCQVNAYLTPPGSQGFAVHSDTHDVFVLQTHGRKLWEVHGPDGREEVLMEPGVCLYLPTGTPHAARAQETASLHVTIGINQLTWRTLLRRATAQAVLAQPDEHLPAGATPAELAAGLAGRLELLAAAVRSLDADALVAAQTREVFTTRPTTLRGGLTDVLAADTVEEDTALARRAGHRCVLAAADSPDRLRLLLGDRSLELPARLRPALEQLRDGGPLTPAELPLDAASAVVLCRRLVREGLLTLAVR